MNQISSDFDEFLHLLEQDPEVVKVFGVIVYSDRNPYVKKVLSDSDFWKSLDVISGRRWAIFAARTLKGFYRTEGGGRPGMMGMMVRVWNEPEENKTALKSLGIQSSEYPQLVVFTKLKNGKILRSSLKLNDSSENEAYARLRSVISELTNAIDHIDAENISDYESVFNAIEMAVSEIRTIDFVKQLVRKWQLIIGLKP